MTKDIHATQRDEAVKMARQLKGVGQPSFSAEDLFGEHPGHDQIKCLDDLVTSGDFIDNNIHVVEPTLYSGRHYSLKDGIKQ